MPCSQPKCNLFVTGVMNQAGARALAPPLRAHLQALWAGAMKPRVPEKAATYCDNSYHAYEACSGWENATHISQKYPLSSPDLAACCAADPSQGPRQTPVSLAFPVGTTGKRKPARRGLARVRQDSHTELGSAGRTTKDLSGRSAPSMSSGLALT